ncbi:hypothetical protein LSS_21650 [Leptospira santarosai serovar Shermani str. LT 821]|uniref:Uncharacterized protein n=1 Tax=Leptospira santarosai serovar Shermani str. LT 821 TaxID=758847 RepID=A0A097ESM1_9LEPT|nr:hypothetical protein LSS_21650 [Leptospira santarosai serovar Shermani str. LT 821]
MFQKTGRKNHFTNYTVVFLKGSFEYPFCLSGKSVS